MPVKTRLAANVGANVLARAIGVTTQMISVPVLLHQWGAELYGEWIVLSSIPSYLAMSDIGFGNVAGNEMTMQMAQGNRLPALALFQSAHLFITSISLACSLALGAILWCLPIHAWLHMHILGIAELRAVVFVLGLVSLVALQENLIQQGYRCLGKTALGVHLKAGIMAAVFSGTVLVAYLGGRPLHVACSCLLIASAGTIFQWLVLRRSAPWFRIGVRHADRSTIRRLAKPAVSFMSFPLSQILSLQGMLLVVGYFCGPVAALVFGTARTVSRSVLQGLQLINASVWPEMSAAYGSREMCLLRRLHRGACQVAMLVCVLAIVILAAVGDPLWRGWTLGRVSTDPVLLNLLLAQMGVGALWYTSAVVPAATNRHLTIAQVILGASCCSLILAGCLLRYTSFGLHGTAFALVASDLVIGFFVLRTSLRLTDDSFGAMFRALMKPPRVHWEILKGIRMWPE